MAGRSASAFPARYHDRVNNDVTSGVTSGGVDSGSAFEMGGVTPSLMEDPHFVNSLTEDERDLIAEVLNRDAKIKEFEEKRLRVIRSEFQRLKDKSAQSLSTALDSSRGSCGVCGSGFSLLLNRGTNCPKCKVRVCKTCQVPSTTPKLRRSVSAAAFGIDSHEGWHCTLCEKRIIIQKQTGEWIFLQAKNRAVRDSWRSKGPDLVRSLLNSTPGSTPMSGTPSLREFRDDDAQWDSRRLLEESRNLLREGASTPTSAKRVVDSRTTGRESSTRDSKSPSRLSTAGSGVPRETLQQKVDRMEIPMEEEDTVDESVGRGRGGSSLGVSEFREDQSQSDDTVSLAPTGYSLAASSEMTIHFKYEEEPTYTQHACQDLDREPTPEALGDFIEIRTVTINKLPEIPPSRPSPILEEPTPSPEPEPPTPTPTPTPTPLPTPTPTPVPSTPRAISMESLVSIYSEAGEDFLVEVAGTIQFSVNYDYKSSRLEVKILRCSNLAVASEKRNTSDPYVKAYLLPDKSRGGKKKTKVKKAMLNPVFNETLYFPLTLSELEHRTLNMVVSSSEGFGRNTFLGEINLPGQRVSELAVKQPKKPVERELLERSNETIASPLTYKGDLVLSVLFVSPERNMSKRGVPSGRGALAVHVKEARNLGGVKANGFSDPFCKCYLLPDRTKAGKQKTDVVKKDCNPRWDHTFVFQDLSVSDLMERAVELTIWDFDKLGSNDFLGGLRLCLGSNASYGSPVNWMDSKGEEISMWQAMIDRPDTWIDGTLILRPHMNQRGITPKTQPKKASSSKLSTGGRNTPVSGGRSVTPSAGRKTPSGEGRGTPSTGRKTPKISLGRSTPDVS